MRRLQRAAALCALLAHDCLDRGARRPACSLALLFLQSLCVALQVLGCMKIARLEQHAAYKLLGIVFIAQFFMFRVVISNYYFVKLAGMVIHSLERPWWAWAGV